MKCVQLKQILLCGAIALLTMAPMVQAETVSIISQPPGNGWYTYGTTFARIIPEQTQHRVDIKLIPRGGGMANPVVVNNGKADFGFTTSNAAVWAKEGLTDIYKGHKNPHLRMVLAGMQQAYTLVIARKAWVDKTGNDTLDKIVHAKSVVIATKPTGSQVPILADFIFKSLGTSFTQLKSEGKIIQIGSGQASQMMRDNAIDVYIDNVPAMHPNVTQMAMTNHIVFIPYSDKVLQAMAKVGLPTGVMPNGTYKGQTSDYRNPVSATVFVTNDSVPAQDVYEVTKALTDSEADIKQTHAPLKYWEPAAIGQYSNVLPLADGAAKYAQEQGWLK